MKLPVGIIKGEDINTLFDASMKYHIDQYYQKFSTYDPVILHSHWNQLIRAIDEVINLPMELNDDEAQEEILNINFDLFQQENAIKLKWIQEKIEKEFGKDVSMRFFTLAMMCCAIHKSYQSIGIYDLMGSGLNLSSSINAIGYLQSRRAYFVTTLNLIPFICKGNDPSDFMDLFNQFLYHIDSCLVQITTSYYNLLLNECLDDFEMTSDGKIAKGNFSYEHLEGFFMEPERLSLIDQLELGMEGINYSPKASKEDDKVFGFVELENCLELNRAAFHKYEVEKTIEFIELEKFILNLKTYCKDDYNVVIPITDFENIKSQMPKLGNTLILTSDDYFSALNNYVIMLY
jgi:hypothetical protein